jgi:hypothetical protein
VANKKIFNQKSFKYFAVHLWVVELTYRKIFFFKLTLRCEQSAFFPLFATGVIDTGGKFSTDVVDTGGKFVTGSTGVVHFAASINNTSGTGSKFATSVVDTGGTP